LQPVLTAAPRKPLQHCHSVTASSAARLAAELNEMAQKRVIFALF